MTADSPLNRIDFSETSSEFEVRSGLQEDVLYMSGPDVREADIAYVVDALRTGWYGPDSYKYVEAFESEFAAFHGRRFGLMTPNCTTAIHLALEGLGVGVGCEVLAPESTWIGSTAGIHHCGAKEVFVDVDATTWCVTEESLEKARTSRTTAAVIVDLYGNMPDWDALERWSKDTGVALIEDAAESLGSQYKGRRAGSFGVASAFSFHRTKTLTTGEGGILLIDDEQLFERCKILRDHGRAPGTYYNTEVAFKYMPSNLMGSLAYGQFQRIDELISNKRRVLAGYRAQLEWRPEVMLNAEPPGVVNGAWATAVVFSAKSAVTGEMAASWLAERDIPVRPFFHPLTSLPAYSDNLSGGPDRNPIAYDLHARGIHLPCAMNLTDEQVAYIGQSVCEMLNELGASTHEST